jgi:hypothetical protein
MRNNDRAQQQAQLQPEVSRPESNMARRARQILSHPAVRIGYFALLLAVTGVTLYRWSDQLPELLQRTQWQPVVAALLVTCLSSLLYCYIQTMIYRHLGSQPGYWTVFRIVSISQLGKFLPGRVLFFGNFYLMSRAAGIGNMQIGAAFTISMVIWILTACLCGLPALALLQPALRYSVLVLPVLLALLIHPRLLGSLLRLAQEAGGRMRGPNGSPPQPAAEGALKLEGLNAAFYFQVGLLYLATWALAGLGAYLSVAAFADVEPSLFPLALASISLGTVVGFLALFAPVGLGVREGIGMLILAPVVGAGVALLSMVLLRGITVVVDLGLALVAMLTNPRPAPDEPHEVASGRQL